MEVRNNERQRRERGKRREKEHDARAFLLPLAQRADKGIRRTGAHAAEQTDDRRKGVRREAGLDDEHRAAERREHGEILPDIRAFLEQEKREQDREKRRHFVEDVRVREDQMVDGVIVAEDTERAAGRAQDEQRKVALLPLKAAFFASEHDRRDRDRDQIAEQRFLCERQIAREAHERRHEREAERREHDIADGLALVGKHSFLLPFFLLRQFAAAFAFCSFLLYHAQPAE